MRVGVDSTKYPGAGAHDAAWLLDEVAREGLDGVFFRSVRELSPTLDNGEMREVAVRARALGLRIEAGIGKVNPFSTPEAPEIRALGGGDYRRAMERMIEAAAEAGIHELWTALCKLPVRPGALRRLRLRPFPHRRRMGGPARRDGRLPAPARAGVAGARLASERRDA